MAQEVLSVPEVTCEHCVSALEGAVGALEGVDTVKVDLDRKDITIDFDDRNSETIVFDRKEALAATEDVLNDNGIRQRASDDLIAVWKAKPEEAKSGGGR